MIIGFVKGQQFSKKQPVIVSNSINYLEARFVFQTSDWSELVKFAHFKSGDSVYDFLLDGDTIPKEAQLNLYAGNWEVYIHGDRYVVDDDGNEKIVERITTNTQTVQVVKYEQSGSVLPEVGTSVAEQIAAVADNAKKIATSVRNEADAGAFDGKDGYTPVKGIDYFDGNNGVSVTHEWEGTVLKVTSASGTTSADLKGETGPVGPRGPQGEVGPQGEKGEPGANGKDGQDGQPGKDGRDGRNGPDGKTPVKGVDYWTDTDKQEIVDDVLGQIDVPDVSVEMPVFDLTQMGMSAVMLPSGNASIATDTTSVISALNAGAVRFKIPTVMGTYTVDMHGLSDGSGAYQCVASAMLDMAIVVMVNVSSAGIQVVVTPLATAIGFPSVTADDNNKILQVVNGAWEKVAVKDSYVATFVDDYISSALEGDY